MFNLDERFKESPVQAFAAFFITTAVQVSEEDKRTRKAQDIQEEQADVDRATQAQSAARERRKQVRQRLVAQGQIENVASQTGGTGGTAAVQSSAVAATQAASNIGQINTTVATKNLQTSLQEDLFKTQIPTGLERGAQIGASLSSAFLRPGKGKP